MAKQQRRPRRSWSERADALDGIRRDKATGIVLAREHRHPLADWFRSVPMGTGLPGMQMPPEAEHLLAIHVFDNLRLPAPKNPLYKPRVDREARRGAGIEAVIWVPVGAPEEDATEALAEPVEVVDISHYSPAQLEAMKAQIRDVEVTRKLIEQSDTGGTM
ncbi:hypothetical protein IU459_11720 [Nocardia amamiensis]|uniref:Uncharacterized protein n=1 Tax=Nocardia amamiensis TaxID=404578 RepID=A0ABS0CNH6_9NOCA|nr:hypothetical protein [Nocardia amamiensis]MBF6298208.1 hypothetical protein [Nocardia amamiensis]